MDLRNGVDGCFIFLPGAVVHIEGLRRKAPIFFDRLSWSLFGLTCKALEQSVQFPALHQADFFLRAIFLIVTNAQIINPAIKLTPKIIAPK